MIASTAKKKGINLGWQLEEINIKQQSKQEQCTMWASFNAKSNKKAEHLKQLLYFLNLVKSNSIGVHNFRLGKIYAI